MYNNISVIIPSIILNKDLIKCIDEIYKISNLIKVIVLIDVNSEKFNFLLSKYENLKIQLLKHKINISQKRNLGVSLTKSKYIAFIDSDAYPDKNWIKNSINTISNNKQIYIVGGPNISPPSQNWQKNLIGEVQKSFLISGKWNFQKRISTSRFTQNLYSCNMIMLRSTYLTNNGMNENLETGEDYDFCNKVNENKKRIFFNKNSIVYHYDRDILNFIIQKIIRGSTIVDQIKKKSSLFTKNFKEFIFYQLIPFYFIIFNAGVIYIYLNEINIHENLNLYIIFIYISYILITFISALNTSKKNIKYLILILLLIIVGNLSIGIGSLLSILGINKIYKYYKNY